MNVQFFDNRVLGKEGDDIGIVTFPQYHITMQPIESGKYTLSIATKTDMEDIFQNDKGIKFEIHYAEDVKITEEDGEVVEKGSMVGLFFFNGIRGWYLDSVEIAQPFESIICVGRLLNNRFEMMKKVFASANT